MAKKPKASGDTRVAFFTVVARKAMYRGGRSWAPGTHAFDSEEKLAELGTPEQIAAMLDALDLYPADFEVTFAEEQPGS